MSSPKLLWQPSKKAIAESNLTKYQIWLRDNNVIDTKDYHSLWNWSVNNIDDFWLSIWNYFNILSDTKPKQVLSSQSMPKATWFKGTNVNYVSCVLVSHHGNGCSTYTVSTKKIGIKECLCFLN